MRRLILLAGLATTFATSVMGAPTTGNDVLYACENEGMAQQGFCLGFIIGGWESMKWEH